MKLIYRLGLLILVMAIGEFLFGLFIEVADPAIKTTLSAATVNGTAVDAGTFRVYSGYTTLFRAFTLGVYSITALFLFIPLILADEKSKNE